MNIANSFKNALLYLMMIVCGLAVPASCSGQAIKRPGEQLIDTTLTLLDSLRITIDTQGHSALVKIIDIGKEQNRIMEIELWNESQIVQTLRNDQLIPCRTCGRQSGDPYVTIDQGETTESNTFNVYLDREVNTFLIDTANVYLQKIDLLHVTPGEDRYLEWHEIYTPADFGKLPFTEVTEDLIFRLRDSTTEDKLQRFYNR